MQPKIIKINKSSIFIIFCTLKAYIINGVNRNIPTNTILI